MEPVALPITAFGWLRRPELDGPGYAMWERPDGAHWAAPPNTMPYMDRNDSGTICFFEAGETP